MKETVRYWTLSFIVDTSDERPPEEYEQLAQTLMELANDADKKLIKGVKCEPVINFVCEECNSIHPDCDARFFPSCATCNKTICINCGIRDELGFWGCREHAGMLDDNS